MNPELIVTEIAALHEFAIINWKSDGVIKNQTDFLNLVEENHAYNYQLWHEEDKARRDDMGFEFVYLAKRNIDHFNQQRNNYMEKMDSALYQQLKPADPSLGTCPVHSETPGMIIDRLSILSLKQYHMALQTKRQDVDNHHVQTCVNKLNLIENQRIQLLSCLKVLLQEVIDKTRTFKLYHQLKMYNDKSLNPELYANQQ